MPGMEALQDAMGSAGPAAKAKAKGKGKKKNKDGEDEDEDGASKKARAANVPAQMCRWSQTLLCRRPQSCWTRCWAT